MVVRPAETALVKPHDEWQVSDRRYLSEGSMALLRATIKQVAQAQLMPAWTPDADPHGGSVYTTPRDAAAVDRMTPHNWHNLLRCHGQSAASARAHCRVRACVVGWSEPGNQAKGGDTS
jgi:hypothetical protein